ncbi:hypothetical protein M8C21_031181 [Ambrosia artemisiifolia]|uniref:SBP-type domain-containing protein n=1 Tax=Ambrosia artemisiifolia TaxID=4212 RepID=A0AAD5CDD4_AMBAR|nr:hypothetical protein M8C21_031181 [Ambrosia artemisiifolia]
MEMGGSSCLSSVESKMVKVGTQVQPPRCQVEGCNMDLSEAKTYYSRHKVCVDHSKTAMVVVNGLQQRFCQQCSRFHQLPEFDQGKRSCRRRLAGHNERRRKPTSRTLLSAHHGSLPSSVFENNGNSGGYFSSSSRARILWPNTTEKLPTLPWCSNLDTLPPCVDPNAPPGPEQCYNRVQRSNHTHSLLSNHASASTNQPSIHEYHVNPHASGTMVQTHGHGQLTGWGYDTDQTHLCLGQIPESGYSGEIGLSQQGGRRYDSSVDHINWSL